VRSFPPPRAPRASAPVSVPRLVRSRRAGPRDHSADTSFADWLPWSNAARRTARNPRRQIRRSAYATGAAQLVAAAAPRVDGESPAEIPGDDAVDDQHPATDLGKCLVCPVGDVRDAKDDVLMLPFAALAERARSLDVKDLIATADSVSFSGPRGELRLQGSHADQRVISPRRPSSNSQSSPSSERSHVRLADVAGPAGTTACAGREAATAKAGCSVTNGGFDRPSVTMTGTAPDGGEVRQGGRISDVVRRQPDDGGRSARRAAH
jgi:hypothetical protein